MGGKNLDEPGKESWGEDEYVAKDIMEYFNQLPAPAAEVPIPTVEEIADHIDVWFRTGEDKPWSFIVEDLAGSIHYMLTKSRGGV
jgi:hypothetical protein